MPTYRLTYFDGAGRAEPIRIAMKLAGLSFEDRRIKFPEFAALKEQGEFPLGAVPMMEIDGKKLVQTSAILRYVAHVAGNELYPRDPYAALLVDTALDTFNDTVSHALTPSLFERDPAKKLEMRKALAAGPIAKACTYVEGLIVGPFLTGPMLTIADILLGETVRTYRSGHLDGLSGDTLAPFPKLRALGDAYLAHPGIVAYSQR